MLNRLRSIWLSVNASYWFFPALFSIIAVLLALISVYLDRSGWTTWLSDVEWLQPARPVGANNMLTVIAGSMIGVASTVFSITIAAVAYASGNYGPRLLTNFMENRGNQLSLATFIGTFVYSLTVLRAVRTGEEESLFFNDPTAAAGFVPQLSLLIAYVLMAISIAVLVFFLNHIPASIRINTVLQGIGERLLKDIRELFPEPTKAAVEMKSPTGREVPASEVGYIQIIDYERLERIADRVGGHIYLGVRTGDFVHRDMTLAYWDDDDELDDLREDEVRECFSLGGMRTPGQDMQFLIDELAEIGLRALSPGINDPFTAITAMHWLGAAMAEIGQRDLRRTFGDAKDAEHDRLTLLADDYSHFLKRGFGPLRGAVATSRTAALVAFDVLANAAIDLQDETRHAALLKEGELLIAQTRLALDGPELHEVEARYQSFAKRMER